MKEKLVGKHVEDGNLYHIYTVEGQQYAGESYQIASRVKDSNVIYMEDYRESEL